MKGRMGARRGTAIGLAVLLGALAAAPGARAEARLTQSLELKAGWNAVYLLVQPDPRDPATVFSGTPVESVWAWLDRRSTVEFVKDPSETSLSRTGWSGWFARADAAALSNLHALFANQAYLIRASEDATVSVTGTPSARLTAWIPNSFNLVGFPADPAAPPTFAGWFAPSGAHAGRAIYRLRDHQQWEFVDDPTAATIGAGESYWVWCEGGSDYQGPVSVVAESGAGLEYGAGLETQTLRVVNHADGPRAFTLAPHAPPDALGLTYRDFDTASGGVLWPDLAAFGSKSLAAGAAATVTIAVRRERLTAGAGSVVEFKADGGVRHLIPARAER